MSDTSDTSGGSGSGGGWDFLGRAFGDAESYLASKNQQTTVGSNQNAKSVGTSPNAPAPSAVSYQGGSSFQLPEWALILIGVSGALLLGALALKVLK